MNTRTLIHSKVVMGFTLVVGLLLMTLFFALSPTTATADTANAPDTNNVVINAGFEGGKAPWVCRRCALTTGSPAQEGGAAAQLSNTTASSRGLLFQGNIALQPNTAYELTFWARSSGPDLQVILQKQGSPYSNYGLNKSFDTNGTWKEFTVTFTTKGFSNPVSDARLLFRTTAGRKVTYSIDGIALAVVGGGSNPPPAPTATPSPGPTATPPPSATAVPSPTPTTAPPSSGKELLVFDWNQPVTTQQRGFPWNQPPMASANGNWKVPVNYAEGTFHIRAHMQSIPRPQPGMRIQFCIWQFNLTLENCTPAKTGIGTNGAVLQWEIPVQNLWKKNGKIINWAEPRQRYGIAIKNGDNKPVSNFAGWNWNGEDPTHWYPMDARFTVVVVEKGAQFSGWGNYIK